jgi:hypothetical protein
VGNIIAYCLGQKLSIGRAVPVVVDEILYDLLLDFLIKNNR